MGGIERKDRVETDLTWKVSIDEVKERGYNLDIKNPHVVADDHGDPIELLARLDASEKQVDALRNQLNSLLEEALLR